MLFLRNAHGRLDFDLFLALVLQLVLQLVLHHPLWFVSTLSSIIHHPQTTTATTTLTWSGD
jgi:hypothetical protein